MITINQILDMFEVLESVGLRPPDIYARPASRGVPSGRAFAASVYAAAFNHGGYLWPEIERAALEYALEPQAEHYPKPWPTPGHRPHPHSCTPGFACRANRARCVRAATKLRPAPHPNAF